MRARDGKFGVKTRPQNCQKLENILEKLRFSFSKTPIFLAQISIFFNGSPISEKSKKIFFNGFLISLTHFYFPQRLSVSKKPSSTAFRFLLYCQNTHTVNILSKYSYREYFVFPLRTSLYFPLANRHSPHSLASVKDMYNEMAFQLNLY